MLRERPYPFLAYIDTPWHPLQKVSPNMRTRFNSQVCIPYHYLYARPEGLVNGGDAVRGEEEDACAVLQHTEEDAHDGVSVDIVGGAALEEDVCFVD